MDISCQVCGAPIARPVRTDRHGKVRRQDLKGYLATKTCGKACRCALMSRQQDEKRVSRAPDPKPCQFCGRLFGPKIYATGKHEPMMGFDARKHCGSKCRYENAKVSTYKHYSYHNYVGRRTYRESGKSMTVCTLCRAKGDDMEVHHINKDPADNRLTNLQLLCIACHHHIHAQDRVNHRHCALEGCDRLSMSSRKEFCRKHMRRLELWGDPNIVFRWTGRQAFGPTVKFIPDRARAVDSRGLKQNQTLPEPDRQRKT